VAIRSGVLVGEVCDEDAPTGASATTAMTHIAIQEKLDGKAVDWLEHVTAEQYEGRPSGVRQVRSGRV